MKDYTEIVELVTKIVKEEITKKISEIEGGYDIPIEVSARHVHLTREALDILYGPGYELTKLRDLSQPGEFAAKETVTLVSDNMHAITQAIPNVRILGPLRKFTQIELSITDAINLGIDPPLRISGDIKGSAPITIVGPKGSIRVKEGAIIALRHIHMTPADAQRYGVKHGEIVKVEIPGPRKTIFDEVVIRVSEKYKLALHLDTDEGNAAGVKPGMFCRIIK